MSLQIKPGRAIAFIVAVGALSSMAGTAFASSISEIEGMSSGTPVTLDNSGGTPVVTNVLSQPGSGDGYTYSNWSFLVNDGTGSLDVFASATTLTGLGYTPTAGDGVAINGTYSPFDSIPEIGTLTAISAAYGTGNPVPGPVNVPFVSALAGVNSADYPLLGHYLEVDNVTFGNLPAGGLFPTHANLTFNMTDGIDTVTTFFWPSSYSLEDGYAGTAIPTGPVDVQGFVDLFGTTPEFTPLVITPVPEPVSASMLLIVGSAALLRRRRRA